MDDALRIRYFAAVRERIDCDGERLEVGDSPPEDVGDVWDRLVERHSDLEGLRASVRIARNGAFADDETPVEAGDELAIIPPVSGGAADRVERFAVRDAPLDREVVRDAVARDAAGAVVSFEGTVRNETRGRSVERLEYEAYESMARAKLVEIGRSVADSRDDVVVAAHHRTGTLAVGETAVVVAASSPHRAAAFEAARAMIDRLKEDVPIWKKEVRADGSEWVGWGG